MSELSPLPYLCLAEFQAGPGAASHTLRSTRAQERCTAIYAQDDNSTVLTHSGFVPESAAVTREKKATHKPNEMVGLGLQRLKAQPQQ